MNIYEDLTTVMEVRDPYYTNEDCVDHSCIAAMIKDNDKILIMDHIKMGCWAVPVGKVKPGDSIENTLHIEMMEELGIEIINYEKIISFVRPYIINGIHVKVNYNIFNILEYNGIIKNLEPHKHRSIKFMVIDDIKKLDRISTATKAVIRYCEDK